MIYMVMITMIADICLSQTGCCNWDHQLDSFRKPRAWSSTKQGWQEENINFNLEHGNQNSLLTMGCERQLQQLKQDWVT